MNEHKNFIEIFLRACLSIYIKKPCTLNMCMYIYIKTSYISIRIFKQFINCLCQL